VPLLRLRKSCRGRLGLCLLHIRLTLLLALDQRCFEFCYSRG
jgi:hypothetical protein